MKSTLAKFIMMFAAASLCTVPMVAAAQGSPPAAQAAPKKPDLATKTPRTADKHPDLNGIWYRPLLFLGAAEQDGETLKAVNRPDPAFAAAIAPLPPMYSPSYKPELEAKVKEYNEQQVKLDPGFFCRPPGVPRIGPPHQIVQTPGQVVFLYSDLAGNFWRIIPTDGRPHLPSTLRFWLGDSRGHWEGDTLVVDTTNYKPQSFMSASSEKLHVIERFTRTGPESLNYEITINDPETWTKPWSLMIPLQRTSDLIYEYACQEGNIGLEGILAGARAEERAAAGSQSRKGSK